MSMLLGKYVFISTENYYKYGKIVECEKDETFFLVQMYSLNADGPGFSLYSVNHMLQIEDEPEGVSWIFFNTKRELDKYISKIEKPPIKVIDNKVIELKRK